MMADMQVGGAQQRALRIHFNTTVEHKNQLWGLLPPNLFEESLEGDCDLSFSPKDISNIEEEFLSELSKDLLICIGDQHGNLTFVQDLYNNLNILFGRLFLHMTILFLGDICDRGKQTRELLDWTLQLPAAYPKQKIHFILGNHCYGFGHFLGLWPATRPSGYTVTNINDQYSRGGSLWGTEDSAKKEVHLQGRRWGGNSRNSVYDSKQTFKSYGVEFSDREGLQAAVPEEHKTFIRDMDWVFVKETKFGKIIGVHAGFEDSDIEPQIEQLRNKDVMQVRMTCLSGTHEVMNPPSCVQGTNIVIVSGHHQSRIGQKVISAPHRIICDTYGGVGNNPLSAVILPWRIIVDSQPL